MRLENKLNKKCEKGCKGKILDKNQGVYCRHIEEQMPKPSRASIDAFNFGSRIENLSVGSKKVLSEKGIETVLIKHGFNQNEVDLFMNKVYGYKRGKKWISPHNMDSHWSKMVKKIRRLGKGIFNG